MKIAVCLKQVPARDSVLRINEAGSWIRESEIGYEVNEPDAYALEEALRLKESAGAPSEVLVCTLGPNRAMQAIKEALAKGADRALHLDDPEFTGLDAHGVARALAAALLPEKPDLIVAGLQSDDWGYAQTGVILAAMLNLPHATIVMEVQIKDEGLRVKRELEGGWFQWIELPLPAVLTVQSGISKLRYVSLRGIMAAKSKPIRKLTRSDLGLSAGDLTPKQKLLRLYFPEKRSKTEFLEGNAKEMAAKLVDKLRNEARVL